MGGKELKRYLQQSLRQGPGLEKKPDGNGARMKETINLCTEIMREQKLGQKPQEEPRTGFIQYLSDIFRFEGIYIGVTGACIIYRVPENFYNRRYSPIYTGFHAPVCTGSHAGYVQMPVLWDE